MIKFISFSFSGDKFYQEKTVVPLGTPGLTLFRGTNYDAVFAEDQDALNPPSNGAGKTRLGQILEGFVFGKTARGPFKKMVSKNFEGTLKFEDLRTKTEWSFSLSSDGWLVEKNGVALDVSHKKSDVQEFLQQTIGISRDEWSYFVQIDGDSLRTLIKGKPAERRAYLEEFFQIDEYYEQKLAEYRALVKSIDKELQLVEYDRARLAEINTALEGIEDVVWLEKQIEFLEETRKALHVQRVSVQKTLDDFRYQLEVWRKYHTLSENYANFKFDKEELFLKKERTELQFLINERKRQKDLRIFIKDILDPHTKLMPKATVDKPQVSDPSADLLAKKEVQLAKMAEKMAVRLEMREIQQKLQDLPKDDPKDIEEKRLALLTEKAECTHHLSILEKTHGKSECPTCGQGLPDKIKQDPDLLRHKLKSMNIQLATFESILSQLKKKEALLISLERTQARYDSFPVWGIKIADLEVEVATLKENIEAWVKFRKFQEKNRDWETNQVKLESQAKAMGFPDLLEQSFDEDIKVLEQSIPQREAALREATEFNKLLDQVLALKPHKELESEVDRLEKELLTDVLKKLEETAELKGRYTRQLEDRKKLLSQKVVLEEKISRFEDLSRQQRILKMCEACYLPSGFKIYELKQRCKLLVERANYWSQLFFQEPYRWSMSEDLDDLNLFVKPVNAKEDPYPVALLSAGERNRAARVLLFAQLEMIPHSKKTNLLLLDEIEANLDEVGIKAFTDVAIPKLKETFPDRSIVIVSHLKSLKNSGHLDHIWQAERRERKTRLTLQPWYNRRA